MLLKRFDSYLFSIHALLIVLAVTVVGLILENRDLRDTLSPPPESQLAAGESISPFAVQDLDGRPDLVRFDEPERETLLFVFTTVCPACKENQARWSSLYEQTKDDFDIVGISLNELEVTRSYRESHRLPFRVVVPADIGEFTARNKISRVPMTVRVGAGGEVRDSWLGILSEDFSTQLAAVPTAVVGT